MPEDIAAMLAKEDWMSGAECVSERVCRQTDTACKKRGCIHSKHGEEFEHMPQEH